ncbi:MAG TPA: DNA polymerase III subunit gamma/tau [Collinsella ihuae]|uniref:DNA-directed DNA polymerase n=1 Tax=Collinsella ihumii TaxID=1720204 RepID=A0A921IRU3_9ACTN|nr:DNA polymerase III subunit gamma/tau [Collinsella ihumii]
MESLYRKYRPLTFESVVGQQHIVSTLKHAVTEGRLSHAYLFCGPRGTGKTTMARILAKALLCQHADAARAEGASGCMPDGTCPECEAIAEGSHPDVYELDAASRTGVDSVREEIISSVNFAPVRGAYKVYIIDEVHMLTAAAFNALLKTLEEPPSHVVFILCTTDPQKILETILSRCQRFDFHRISNEDIVGRLRYICEQEGFDADDEALEIVARHARGGMRDALSTLEQLSVFGDGAVRVADARALLGEVSGTVLAEFARGIAARDVVGLFGMIRAQVDEGNDLLEFTRDAVAHMRDVYTARVAGGRSELFDGTPDEVAALVEEASLFESADRLARVLTVLDDAAIEMRNASDARLVLEIACTRLARPESDLTLEALAERLDRIEAQLAAGVPSAPMGAAGVAALTGAARDVRPAPAPVPTRTAAGDRAPAPSRAAAGADDLPWNVPAESSKRAAAPTPQRTTVQAARGDRTAPAPAEAPSAIPVGPAASAPAPVASASAGPHTAVSSSAEATRSKAAASAPKPVMPPVPAAATLPVRPAQPAPAPVSATPAPEPSASEAPAAAGAASDAGELQRRWAEVVKRVTAAQASRGALLQSSRAQSDDGERLVVGFPKGSGFAVKMLGRADSHELIMPIVRAVFGARAVDYVMDGASAQPAPAAPAAPAAAQPAPETSAAPATRPAPAAQAAPVQTARPQASSAQSEAARPASPSPAVQAPAPAAVPSSTPKVPSAPSPAQQVPVSAPASSVSAAVPAPDTAPVAPAARPAASAPIAPAPARSSAPAAPAPASAAVPVDQMSGPTIVREPDIEADRRAWEDEQVPYDDAMIAAYDDEEMPPFDLPPMPSAVPAPAPSAPVQSPASAPAEPAPAPAPVAPTPAAPVAAPSSPAGAAPWAGSPTAGNQDQFPQSEDEAKAMLDSIFGDVVYK